MRHVSYRLLPSVALVLLFAGVSALPAARPKASTAAATPGAPAFRGDPEKALRRARLEQGLIQAEKTAILLGELVDEGAEEER